MFRRVSIGRHVLRQKALWLTPTPRGPQHAIDGPGMINRQAPGIRAAFYTVGGAGGAPAIVADCIVGRVPPNPPVEPKPPAPRTVCSSSATSTISGV